jgi:hypothetical protein
MTKTSIRVWVRSLGNSCRIRVESMENARWLLEHLAENHALPGLTQVEIQPTEDGCLFQISNTSQRTLATLEHSLRQIPEVELMLSPEST